MPYNLSKKKKKLLCHIFKILSINVNVTYIFPLDILLRLGKKEAFPNCIHISIVYMTHENDATFASKETLLVCLWLKPFSLSEV